MNSKYFIAPLLILCLSACSSDSQCSDLSELINTSEKNTELIYDDIETWQNSNWREKFMHGFVKDFKPQFGEIRNQIKLNDQDKMDLARNSILEALNSFILFGTTVERWSNTEHFWLLENAMEDLESLKIPADGKCNENVLLQSFLIEERILNEFYMLSFMEEHGFNKIEPSLLRRDWFNRPDTAAITIGFYGYDSMACNKFAYELETQDGLIITDSVNCNWLLLPEKYGRCTIKGTMYYSMFGQMRTAYIEEEIEL